MIRTEKVKEMAEEEVMGKYEGPYHAATLQL
jgi:hypothetical protein